MEQVPHRGLERECFTVLSVECLVENLRVKCVGATIILLGQQLMV